MVKSDKWLKKMAVEEKMIEPFESSQVRDRKISYGTSSYGYDMRLSNEFKIAKRNIDTAVIDPKQFQENLFKNITVKDYYDIYPNSIILGKSVEYFRIPRDVIAIAFGKSTYARCGIFVNITPFEPEWEGYITLSIANTASVPVRLYVNEGIAQVLFLETSGICEVSYADKKGKYQTQTTVTSAKL
ncbi:MAG: dCTP deaminase [Endomicrobium sp.]|nr:dCTP deaminase [Endomicrobium sp.]